VELIDRAAHGLADGMFAGRPCFVVGGGPSMRGFRWDRLRGRLWIGINMAYRYTPTISYIEDMRLIEREIKRPEYLSCGSIKLYHPGHPTYNRANVQQYGVHILPSTKSVWSLNIGEGVACHSNAGVGAVNLADALGADPIYLLGFDMKPGQWHDDYPETWKAQRDQFLRYRRAFEEFVAPNVRARVFNLGPDSDMDCFPELPMETVLP